MSVIKPPYYGIVGIPQSSIDPNASAYLSAVGETDPTKKAATDTFFRGAKTDGFYSKLTGFSLCLGSTIANYGVNAKSPGTYNAVATNSPIAGSDGIEWVDDPFNRTYLTISGWDMATNGDVNSFSMGYYAKTNDNATDEIEISIDDPDIDLRWIIAANYGASTICDMPYYAGSGRVFTGNPIITNSPGFYSISKNSLIVAKAYVNGSVIGTAAPASPPASSAPLRIGGSTQNSFFTDKTCQFYFWGTSMTDADMSNMYTRIQTFLTAIGR